MGVLFDLGVSSPQLDRAERGFSFRQDGPLDMRMDTTSPRTAADVVNDTSAEELAEVLRRYGDERFARRIARAVVEHRPITTTRQLADVVADAIPAPARRKSTGHPARRSFQAIRIEVNQELEVLADALDQAIAVLQPGGRIIVTFGAPARGMLGSLNPPPPPDTDVVVNLLVRAGLVASRKLAASEGVTYFEARKARE